MTITNKIYQHLQQLSAPESLEVLQFLKFLEFKKTARWSPTPPTKRLMTAQDLLASDLVGMWVDREDIEDSLSYAQRLRIQAQQRDLG